MTTFKTQLRHIPAFAATPPFGALGGWGVVLLARKIASASAQGRPPVNWSVV